MSEIPDDNSVAQWDQPEFGDDDSLPEDLPPVKPPSAGFIIQLFLIPGLIVMVVIGIWALFGQMAAGEQDWRTLIVELQSDNEHRRWRGAMSLADLLKSDGPLTLKEDRLSRNPQIARALADLLLDQLKRDTHLDDDLKLQAFLARTLGLLDMHQVVVPVLQTAMASENDREVRKNSVASIALIAGRADERNEALKMPSLVDDLIDVSADPDPLFRQLGAYALGLLPDQEARQRLAVMLNDSDESTRVNAAIGLARRKSSEGLEVFQDVLKEAAKPFDSQKVGGNTEFERKRNAQIAEYEKYVIVKNTLKALEELTSILTPAQRSDLIVFLEPIAMDDREKNFIQGKDARQKIAGDARKLLKSLKASGP
jgi:hypothetical protein